MKQHENMVELDEEVAGLFETRLEETLVEGETRHVFPSTAELADRYGVSEAAIEAFSC